MPRRNINHEDDRVWAMSDSELVRSGTKLVGRVLCGNTQPRDVVSHFRHSRTFTHPSGSWVVVHSDKPDTELHLAEGFQPSDSIPNNPRETVTFTVPANMYTWVNEPIATTSYVTTAQNLQMAEAQRMYEYLNNNSHWYIRHEQQVRRIQEESRAQIQRQQRENQLARVAQRQDALRALYGGL